MATDASTKEAVSDAQRRLNNARGLAELSRAAQRRDRGRESSSDGQLVTKEVTINATVRSPRVDVDEADEGAAAAGRR